MVIPVFSMDGFAALWLALAATAVSIAVEVCGKPELMSFKWAH